MIFEHRTQPLIPFSLFLWRVFRYAFYSFLLVFFSIVLGMIGYHYIGKLIWIDAFLNASMILTGMGPVDRMVTSAGKIFAAIYALYSGVAFLSMIAVLFAPVLHRFMHHLHLDDNKQSGGWARNYMFWEAHILFPSITSNWYSYVLDIKKIISTNKMLPFARRKFVLTRGLI